MKVCSLRNLVEQHEEVKEGSQRLQTSTGFTGQTHWLITHHHKVKCFVFIKHPCPMQNERWAWKWLKGTVCDTCEQQKLVYSTYQQHCKKKRPDFSALYLVWPVHISLYFNATIPSWGSTLLSDKSLNSVQVEEETLQGVNNWVSFSKPNIPK